MLWNGQLPTYAPRAHAWAAAYSWADLLRLLDEAGVGKEIGHRYLRQYWHAGCWGRVMDGITPERGLWVQKKELHDPIIKLYPTATVRRISRSRS